MSQMIIANRLNDGLVVFLGPNGSWVESIEDGLVIDSADAQAMLSAAKLAEDDCVVIDPNLIDIEHRDGKRWPSQIREAIRAFGPSPEAKTDREATIRE